VIPWPWLGLFLGVRPNGSLSFISGVLTCWLVAVLAISASVWFSVWGTQKGLTGNFASDAPRPSAANQTPRFGKEPLYRKEMLWFIRDRSAIVQTLFVPLSVAGLQVFNLRGVLIKAEGAWNYRQRRYAAAQWIERAAHGIAEGLKEENGLCSYFLHPAALMRSQRQLGFRRGEGTERQG
jgi:hypothetical protein